jgi:glycosyltransferase involved in cell wall biosynthesis
MKVLIATDYFPPHVGGVEQVTYHLAEELLRLGHSVVVLTLNTCSESMVEDLNGMRVYRANTLELTNTLGVQSAISTAVVKLMREVCRIEQPDILHANHLYFCTTLAACLNLKVLRVPMVTTMHTGSISELEGVAGYAVRLYERSIGRWILARSDHIVAVSQAVKRYAEMMGVGSRKISVVPNAVDTVKFRPCNLDQRDGTIRVGFIGRLISYLGPQYLVEAAPEILQTCRNVQFLVAGEGPILEELQHRVQQLGVAHAFRFLGTVPSVEFLQSCDVLVRPSLADGMPLTVLEAMACGIPTVVSRVGGNPEILQDRETGYLVEPRDLEQLVSRISRLVTDEKLRARIGSHARRFVETYHRWDQIALQMSAIYEETTIHKEL